MQGNKPTNSELAPAGSSVRTEKPSASMSIEYSPHMLRVVIEDMERALWLDGRALYYKIPKDYRPDMYNVQDVDDAMQIYYTLSKIGSVPELENLKRLGEIYVAYADHVLGRIIKTEYGKENLT